MRLGILAAGLAAGCAADRPLKLRLDDCVDRPDRSVVIFFIDGLGREAYDRALSEGRIPNIRRHIHDRAARVQNAVACIPSITYANAVTFITGRHPGHHGIVSNKWFDRRTTQYQNYGFITSYRDVDNDYRDTPTLYEIMHDRVTVNLQAAQRRGVTHTIDNWATSGINWFFGNYAGVDCLVAQDFELIAQRAPGWGRWPDLIMAYFPGVDEVSHRFGTGSDAHRRAVENVDRQIGRICQALADVGMYEKTYLCLVSDHGFATIRPDRHFDVLAFLQGLTGNRVWSDEICRDEATRRRLLRDCDYALAASGTRWAAVYAIDPSKNGRTNALAAWLARLDEPSPGGVAPPNLDRLAPQPPPWLVEVIEHPAIELVACSPSPGVVHLFQPERHAVIRRSREHPGRFVLTQARGREIIDDLPPALRSGETVALDDRQWLHLAADARYPDLVPQIAAMFDSPRAGDIVLFAAEGWNFDRRAARAGHGSILRDDMLVPMLFAGPDIPVGDTIPVARNTDVMPTILGLLGIPPTRPDGSPIQLDGIDLLAGR